MATKHTETQAPEVVIESALNQTEDFLHRNAKNLLVALAVVVIVVGGYFGYKYLYSQPRAVKASEMMFVAQQQFAIDSFEMALNGDGNNDGFLDVIAKFGSTEQGNLAKHYTGVCYLHMGDMDKALEYLSLYSGIKGAPGALINAQNFGLQGDINVQKGDYDKAATLFEKAVSASDNSFTAPYYLKKAGLVYQKLGNGAQALIAFRRIADEFPSSMEARDIEKLIGQQEQK